MDRKLIKLNIQKLRNLEGISQEELADRIYSTKQNISKYERGDVTPPIPTLIDIAQYFNVTLDDLVNDRLISDKLNIRLDYELFLKNYNVNILKENLSNIELKNNIYVSNINKELAVIDHYDEVPHVEYISNHSVLDKLDFEATLSGTYNRDLCNSEIHHTDSLLTVSELLKIISSLGANYDYFQKPGSLKLDITDEFIALVKLCSISEIVNGKIQINLEYYDLLLSLYRKYYDITFSLKGYHKNRERVNDLIKEIYNTEFDLERIKSPLDEAAFLQYIVEFKNQLPGTLDELYTEFNDKSNDVYTEIGLPFIKSFTEKILRKIMPDMFEINVNYNLKKNRISVNGIMNDIAASANNADQASYVNYLITEIHDKFKINETWRECFYEYAASLGLVYDDEDFYKGYLDIDDVTYRDNNDRFMEKYNDFIKTKWVFNKVRLLDINTLKIIKSIIHKEVIK